MVSMKTKIIHGFILVLATLSAFGSPSTDPVLRVTPAIINQFAEEMRTNHPALLASRARTNAAAAGIKAVRTWDDPMFRIGGMAADTTMRADNGDIIYSAEQKIPLFGKARAARAIASAELDVEVATEDFQFQILRREFAKTVFRAALAEEIVRIGEQDFAWIEMTTKVVEESYRSGSARLMDVLQLQNERSKRIEQLQTDRNQLSHEKVSLNRFLDRPLDSLWPALELPPLAGAVVHNERLVDFALRNEPKLKIMREQIRQTEASVVAARKARLPDVTLGVENRNYSRNGELRQTEVMLGFTIPFGNNSKYRADIRREDEKRKAAEYDAKDYELSVREEVHGLTVKIDSMRREALLYRDQIIPRSEQAFASARSMFESGGALRDVLDARRMLLESRLMFARAVAGQYEMLSELVLCCGLGDLEALQMLNTKQESQSEGAKP